MRKTLAVTAILIASAFSTHASSADRCGVRIAPPDATLTPISQWGYLPEMVGGVWINEGIEGSIAKFNYFWTSPTNIVRDVVYDGHPAGLVVSCEQYELGARGRIRVTSGPYRDGRIQSEGRWNFEVRGRRSAYENFGYGLTRSSTITEDGKLALTNNANTTYRLIRISEAQYERLRPDVTRINAAAWADAQQALDNQQQARRQQRSEFWSGVISGLPAVVQGLNDQAAQYAQWDAQSAQMIADINAQQAAEAARLEQENRDRQAREQSAREAATRQAQSAAGRQYAPQGAPMNDMAAQLRAQQAEDEATARREKSEARQRAADEQARRVARDRENQQRAEAEARRQAAAAAEAERNRLVEFKETVTLCERIGASGERGEWTCHGPLQRTWGRFDTASGMGAVRNACGSDSVRDLGVVGTYRAFGCGFGIHPLGGGQFDDIPARYGVSFIPGRIVFRCPNSSTNTCRTQ